MTTNGSLRYYIFSFSNFLAAIGGGMILGKGVGVLNIPFLRGSSLLAFFTGTLFGLIFLQLIPKNFSSRIARYFSIFGGMTSFIMLYVFIHYSSEGRLVDNPALWFFFLLSLRFGFWFYSRVLRAAAAANQNQNIAWVEFGYYTGVIVGLVLWTLVNPGAGMTVALFIDAILQIMSGFLDLWANKLPKAEESTKPTPATSDTQRDISPQLGPYSNSAFWCWRLALSVMLMTVNVQAIIFCASHRVLPHFAYYVLAAFYLGAAISAIVYKLLHVRLEWNNQNSNTVGYATIVFGNNKSLSFLCGNILLTICMAMVAFSVIYGEISNNLGSFNLASARIS